MILEQDGKCAVCSDAPNPDGPRNQRVLNIDHDHETGKVRALLCYNCNLGLGRFFDDPVRLEKAAAYLRSYM